MLLKVQVDDEDIWGDADFVDFFRWRMTSEDVDLTYTPGGLYRVIQSRTL